MLSRRRLLVRAALSACGACSVGCGTILHPERRGQPAGPLDWSIVALDAVGLLFFFVPGVIAFAVDFNNGTIYLPPEQHYGGMTSEDRRLTSRKIDGDARNVRVVERTVSAHVGQDVALQPGRFETRPLSKLDDFWTTHAEVVAG
ncbi:MAG TPA: hypothetical protein VM165_00655 [Planctomycetaceae bacterium]|nr:hypothetical protein [Planctomycetaceae bacterium]